MTSGGSLGSFHLSYAKAKGSLGMTQSDMLCAYAAPLTAYGS